MVEGYQWLEVIKTVLGTATVICNEFDVLIFF